MYVGSQVCLRTEPEGPVMEVIGKTGPLWTCRWRQGSEEMLGFFKSDQLTVVHNRT